MKNLNEGAQLNSFQKNNFMPRTRTFHRVLSQGVWCQHSYSAHRKGSKEVLIQLAVVFRCFIIKHYIGKGLNSNLVLTPFFMVPVKCIVSPHLTDFKIKPHVMTYWSFYLWYVLWICFLKKPLSFRKLYWKFTEMLLLFASI